MAIDISSALQLAFEYYQSGNLQQAEYLCREILKIHSDNAEICNNLGLILSEKGQLDEAVTCYKRALQLDPNLADAHYNLGNALKIQNQIAEAIKCYRKAIKLDPTLLDAFINLGNALQIVGNNDEAKEYYQIALQLSPDNADIYNNLGLTFQKKNLFDGAIFSYQKAIQLNPHHRDVHNNLGFAYQQIGKIDEAIECYRKAIQLDSNYANAHWNLSRALLLIGDYEEGWREYEWRWKADTLIITPQKCSQSLFTLENIYGKTILLHAEQGFGDNIQFIRYAPMLARWGTKVIVECHEELFSLFQNMEGIYQIIGFNEQPPFFDLNCPLLSLPLIFRTTLETIPANVPYLSVSSLTIRRWKERFVRDHSKLRVGLVWHGNPKIPHKHLSLNHFARLAEIKDVIFYSLQKGEAAEQAKHPPQEMRLVDYTAEVKDFSDTAAIIENLDLVITIDTAVAHLAGALGRLVWTLIPFAPDWRWLLDREDSPWYPTMKLFRQPSPVNWESVIVKIKDELLRLSDKRLSDKK